MSTIITTGVSAQGAPPGAWNLNGMVFDAWLRLNHNTGLTITQHPVETGAAISDHSFINPRRYSFDIGMTDTVESPNFPGFSTRSINAYNALVEMQQSRTLLTLSSKYGNYDNILIENIDTYDDFRTKNAMRATITLLQVIMADTRTARVSSNPQATDLTRRGQQSPQSINKRYTDQVVNWLGGFLSE